MDIEKISYYTSNGIKLMNRIEDASGSGKMFHEMYAEIEQSFWTAADAKDAKALMRVYNTLAKLCDEVEAA